MWKIYGLIMFFKVIFKKIDVEVSICFVIFFILFDINDKVRMKIVLEELVK